MIHKLANIADIIFRQLEAIVSK